MSIVNLYMLICAGRNAEKRWAKPSIGADVIVKSLDGIPNDHIHCAGLASLTFKKAIIKYITLSKEPWKKAYDKDKARE